MLSIIEGEVLGTKYIRELLMLVDDAPDETEWLVAERDRLQAEHDRLVQSVASGMPAASVAPLVATKLEAIRKLKARLRAPRVQKLTTARLRSALEQRAAQWKVDLRAEPKVARMVLRRLVGPLTLWDETERPAYVRWVATPKTELLDGLATLLVASPRGTNRILKATEYVIEVAAA